MRSTLLVVVAMVPIVALSLAAGSLLRPRVRSLPDTADAINARWHATQSWRPEAAQEPADALLRALSVLPDTGEPPPDDSDGVAVNGAELAAWYDADGTLPGIGCPMVASLAAEDPAFPPTAVFLATEPLLDEGRSDAVYDLAAQMRQRDLVSLMLGLAMVETAISQGEVHTPLPTAEELFNAIAYEAECADRVFDAKPFHSASSWVQWHFVPGTERTLLRWYYAELLHALHPVRHNPSGMAAILADREAKAQPLENTLLAGTLSVGNVRAARDYLRAVQALTP